MFQEKSQKIINKKLCELALRKHKLKFITAVKCFIAKVLAEAGGAYFNRKRGK